MSEDENELNLKNQALEWLREGSEYQAATLLERCDLKTHYVDSFTNFDSQRSIDIIEVDLYISRQDSRLIDADKKLSKQIKEALLKIIGADTHIKEIRWHGKATAKSKHIDDISSILTVVDSVHVQQAWGKAIERRITDPEGAITIARSLVESVCKHILDDRGVEYSNTWDLAHIYKEVSKTLSLAPDQYTEQAFKKILGGCTTVVDGLANLRNALSDSHGKSKRSVKPSARHAQLAVNLAGALATFLIETHNSRSNDKK